MPVAPRPKSSEGVLLSLPAKKLQRIGEDEYSQSVVSFFPAAVDAGSFVEFSTVIFDGETTILPLVPPVSRGLSKIDVRDPSMLLGLLLFNLHNETDV